MSDTSSKSINLTILAALALLCSGAGYVGELPKLGKPFPERSKNTNKLSKTNPVREKKADLLNNTSSKELTDSGKPAGLILGESKNIAKLLKSPDTDIALTESYKPTAIAIREFHKKDVFSSSSKLIQNSGKPSGLIVGEFTEINDLLSELRYEEELTKLDRITQASLTSQFSGDPVEKELLEMAPKDFPEVYLGSMVGYGKYSRYLSDLKDISPYMQSISSLIENGANPKNIQMFSAKANMYNLIADKMKRKYINKPEGKFESFENIVKLREVLKDTQDYWYNQEKYKKFFHGNITDKEDAKYVLDEKFEEILDLISLTLDTIRDNSLD